MRKFNKHELIKIVGGKYYDKNTDTTYWYIGTIRDWFGIKFYNIKKKMTLKWYDLKMIFLLFWTIITRWKDVKNSLTKDNLK